MTTNTKTGLEIRPAHGRELDSILRVLCDSFALDFDAARELFYADPLFCLDNKWVAVEDGEVVSTLTVQPVPMRIGDSVILTAGISGVATHPNKRRKGYARKLITEVLRNLPKKNCQAAALIPWEYKYYRQFGFELSATNWRATFHPSALLKYPERTEVRPALEEDFAVIKNIHRNNTIGRTGAYARTDLLWKYVFWNNRRIVVYGKPAQAYMIFELGYDNQSVLKVREMFSDTAEGLRGLVGYIASNRDRADRVEVSGSYGDINLFAHSLITNTVNNPCKPIFSAEQYPGFCWRIVMLDEVIKTLFAQKSYTCQVNIVDPIFEENNRTIALPIASDTPTPPDLTINISVLSQLVIGSMNIRQAASMGLLKGWDAVDLCAFDDVFPLRHPSMLPTDYF